MFGKLAFNNNRNSHYSATLYINSFYPIAYFLRLPEGVCVPSNALMPGTILIQAQLAAGGGSTLIQRRITAFPVELL